MSLYSQELSCHPSVISFIESLVNRLLRELFEYFDTIQLLRIFYNLIFIHFRVRCLDFQSISKQEFNIIRQKHLPSMLHTMISLHVSNDDGTPEQINLLFLDGCGC